MKFIYSVLNSTGVFGLFWILLGLILPHFAEDDFNKLVCLAAFKGAFFFPGFTVTSLSLGAACLIRGWELLWRDVNERSA